MGMVKVDFKQLKDFQKKLQQSQKQVQPTLQDIADDIASEYLQKVKAKTPNTNTNELKTTGKQKLKKLKTVITLLFTIIQSMQVKLNMVQELLTVVSNKVNSCYTLQNRKCKSVLNKS